MNISTGAQIAKIDTLIGDTSTPNGLATPAMVDLNGDSIVDYAYAGDLPALKADKSGRARLEADLDGVTLAPGPNSIVGRGVIIHADPDDYRTQPTGNAGARIAGAVIQRS